MEKSKNIMERPNKEKHLELVNPPPSDDERIQMISELIIRSRQRRARESKGAASEQESVN